MAWLRQLLCPSGLKVLRDLWWDRKRTLIAVLSLAVSVFTIGTVIQLRMTMTRDMEATYASVNPANAIIYTVSHFDSDLVTALRRMPELAYVEGRQSIFTRFRLASNGEWHPIELIAGPIQISGLLRKRPSFWNARHCCRPCWDCPRRARTT